MVVCRSWQGCAHRRWMSLLLLGLFVCLGCARTTPDQSSRSDCDDAQQRIARGAFGEAAEILDRVLAANQKHARAVYYRAIVHEAQGQRQKAIEGYADAIRIDGELRGATGANAADFGGWPEGILGKELALAHWRQGRLFAEANKLPDAITAFTAALAGDGGCVEAYADRGAAFLTQKLPDLAIDDLTQALRLKADFADALCRRAQALLMKNEVGQAADDCRAAIRAAPHRADAYATLGAAYIAMSPPRFRDAEVCFQQAVRHNPAAEAAIQAEAAQRWLDRAVALHAEGSRGDAKAALERAVAIDRKHEASFIALAQAAAAPQAVTLLKPVLPDDRVLKLRERGRELLNKKQYAEAERVFTEAIEADRRDAGAYCGRGQANLERGFPDTALADFDEAVRLDAHNALAYCYRSRAQLALSDYSRAVLSATYALRIDPRLAAAYQQRAEAYLADRNYERAVADMKEAISIDARLGDAGKSFLIKAYVSWGARSVEQRHAHAAVRAFEEAVGLNPVLRESLSPQIVAARRMYAAEQFKRGDVDAALQSLAEALQDNSNDAETYLARGRIHFQQGRWKEAANDLKTALKLDARLGGLVRIDLAEAQRRRDIALPASQSTQDSP